MATSIEQRQKKGDIGAFAWKPQRDLADRMDPAFWDPHLLSQIEKLHAIPHPIVTLGDLDPFITYGPIVVGSGLPDGAEGPYFINTSHLLPTGLGPLTQCVPRGSEWDIPRCRVQQGDVLLVRSGVATLGRTIVYLEDEPAIVGCYVDIVRQEAVDPCYLCVFLKSRYGQLQIQRLKNGVGTVNLSFAQIRSIQLPILPDSTQNEIAEGYRQVHALHTCGNRELAEQHLRVLIQHLERMFLAPYQ